MKADENWYNTKRYGGLVRFGLAITIFNILGHAFFGFEQSYLHPIVAVLVGYSFELSIAFISGWVNKRRPQFLNSKKDLIIFLLPAHISSLAISMLVFPHDYFAPMIFAIVVALGSKHLFQITLSGKLRHFLNPSNFGITVTLLIFPWVGVSPPYQFTEVFQGWHNWILPVAVICTGSLLNGLFTKRLPLIFTWVASFILLGMIRCYLEGMPIGIPLLPVTGVAFIVYTFYMITDPATTPHARGQQIAFGFFNALIYHILTYFNIIFGIFFALTLVCIGRALLLYVADRYQSSSPKEIMAATA